MQYSFLCWNPANDTMVVAKIWQLFLDIECLKVSDPSNASREFNRYIVTNIHSSNINIHIDVDAMLLLLIYICKQTHVRATTVYRLKRSMQIESLCDFPK